MEDKNEIIKCSICKTKRSSEEMGKYKTCQSCRERSKRQYQKNKERYTENKQVDPVLAENSSEIERDYKPIVKEVQERERPDNKAPKYSFEQYGQKKDEESKPKSNLSYTPPSLLFNNIYYRKKGDETTFFKYDKTKKQVKLITDPVERKELYKFIK